MWSSPDVVGLFSNNVVSFSRNVVLRDHLFSVNLVSKPRMLSVRTVYVLGSLQLTVVGLLATVPLNLALNTSNNVAIGAAGLAGMSYFWMVVTAVFVIAGSIVGPWMISRAFLAGSTGVSAIMAASAAAGAAAYRSAFSAGSSFVGGVGRSSAAPSSPPAPASPPAPTRSNGATRSSSRRFP